MPRSRWVDSGRSAYRARRDCCSPVPLMTASHFVSESASMASKCPQLLEVQRELRCVCSRRENFGEKT